jgi:hypothetical protein
MYNFFSLGWAVTLACFQGLIQREGVFLRTPKSQTTSRAWHAIHVTQWETTIGLLCIAAGLLSYAINPNWRTLSLCILLIWQGSLYLAAPIYSLMSLRREAKLSSQVSERGRPVAEQWAARWVVAVSMVLVAAFSLVSFLPEPVALPDYTRFLPVNLSISSPGGSDEPVASGNGNTATVTVHSANCRERPRANGERVTILYAGDTVEITGRNEDVNNPWWYVKIPNSTESCWLWGMTAETSGPVEQLPIVR